MQQQTQPHKTQPPVVRAALPTDIPALMRLKRLLAEEENSLHAVRATEAHWLRDGFGPNAGFCAFVAEAGGVVVASPVVGNTVVGMATCSKRVITGWNGPIVFLQDLFVEAEHRKHGTARALTARVAAYACEIGSPIVELTVRADNAAAQNFYRQAGCTALPECLTYVLAGPSLAALAGQHKPSLALAG
jgi:ribosomal protein S18 acetylase RimI-like enzyme